MIPESSQNDSALIKVNIVKTKLKKNTVQNSQNGELLTVPFSDFWNLYDYKVGKPDAVEYWNGRRKLKSRKKMTDEDRKAVMLYLPIYVSRTHKDDTFPGRKHPKSFLYNSSWLDELPAEANNENGTEAWLRERAEKRRSEHAINVS